MLNRFSYIFLLGLLALAAFLYLNYTNARDERAPSFTGADRCRVCHEASSAGAQFRIWSEGPHARAFRTLNSDTAQSYMGAHKLTADSCLGCHTTLGREARNDGEKQLNMEGVSCERCHGPGSNYSDYSIMTDREAFLSHGGVSGKIRDCYQCHAAEVATERHCPFQTEDFNADSAWMAIRHPVPDHNTMPDTVIDLR